MLFDPKINQDILKELKTYPVLVQLNNHNNKRIQYVHRMNRSRHLHAVMKYQPLGKRNPGHPLKRFLDYVETVRP